MPFNRFEIDVVEVQNERASRFSMNRCGSELHRSLSLGGAQPEPAGLLDQADRRAHVHRRLSELGTAVDDELQMQRQAAHRGLATGPIKSSREETPGSEQYSMS